MKALIKFLPVLFLLISCRCVGQNVEFTEYANGLIYNDTTMAKLRYIVDSMNLKYRSCDPYKKYFSLQQSNCHYVTLDSLNVKSALRDIKNNISYTAFKSKYPHASSIENLVCIRDKYSYINWENKRITEVNFNTVGSNNYDDPSLTFDGKDTVLIGAKLKGKWLCEYHPKTDYSQEYITAMFFLDDFTTKEIPLQYSKMIQYVDCMIDTNAQVFLENSREQYGGYLKQWDTTATCVTKFLKYIHKITGMPSWSNVRYKDNYDEYYSDYKEWLGRRDALINEVKNTNKFKKLFSCAVAQALEGSVYYDEEMEGYVEQYDSKEDALTLKRNRKVIGGCSQDQSPRYHALEIAILSAETTKWDIFLRAHLDIMNDRFERVSDGSYAWGRRNTYIKELESLNIDADKLILGISLRIANPSGYHYFGSIGRLGRALSESEHTSQIEKQMVDMISDRNLDMYNRILIYYLYNNYIYFLKDEEQKNKNRELLTAVVKTLPPSYVKRFSTPQGE